MQSHLSARWNINTNLYRKAINNQKQYLKQILEDPNANHRNFFKRDGIVNERRNENLNSTTHMEFDPK